MHRRREFPSRVKHEAWDRCKDADGIPRCEDCTARLSTANVHYDERLDGEFDHDLADNLLGEPTLDNCKVRCKTCHLRKTKRDRKLIAKGNHSRDRDRGIRPTPMQSLPGSRRSKIKIRIGKPPVWRDSGKSLWTR